MCFLSLLALALVGCSDDENNETDTTTIEIRPSMVNINVGEETALTAVITPINSKDKTVMWSSSDESVATVSSNGTVKGIGEGTAIVIAELTNGRQAQCIVSVIKPIAVENVLLNYTSLNLIVGQSEILIATIEPNNATNKLTHWISDNIDVAIVDDNGVITAISEGTTKITVTTDDGTKSTSCNVTVRKNNNDIDYNPYGDEINW